jgi:hypothetical protein
LYVGAKSILSSFTLNQFFASFSKNTSDSALATSFGFEKSTPDVRSSYDFR